MTGQFHTPAALPSGKNPRYALNRRLGGPQGRSELLRRKEKCLDPVGDSIVSLCHFLSFDPESCGNKLSKTINKFSSLDVLIITLLNDVISTTDSTERREV